MQNIRSVHLMTAYLISPDSLQIYRKETMIKQHEKLREGRCSVCKFGRYKI